jgi:hypothetical protein
MFLGLNSVTHTYLFLFVLILSFLIGYIMHLVMMDSGFGILGNQCVSTAGFYLGLYGAQYYGYSVRKFPDILTYGIGSAFGLLFCLVILKALSLRL